MKWMNKSLSFASYSDCTSSARVAALTAQLTSALSKAAATEREVFVLFID
jgi:hypothetical protein